MVRITHWWNDTYLSLTSFYGGITQQSSTQPWKWLHGALGQKKIPVGPALHYVTQTLLWRYFRFLFLFSVLLFHKRFDVLFSRLFFFRFLIQSVIQSHIQTVKRSVIRSVTRSVIRSVIRSGPDFIDVKLKQSRTYQVRCRVEDFNPEPSALITILIGFWRWLAG